MSAGGATTHVPTRRRAVAPTTADMRRDNLGRVLRLVHQQGPLSRASITRELGLARGTVGVLLEALVDAGLLVERSPESNGTRGRPSPRIDTVPMAATACAVDLGVDAVRLAVVGLGGRILARDEWPHAEPRGADGAVARLVTELRAVAVRRRRAGTAFQAVGVACWGIVRSNDGFVHTIPNLGWRNVPLGRLLRSGLAPGRPTARPLVQHIAIANDADLGAVAEYRRGAGAGSPRLLYVHSGVGVGGGLLLDGEVVGATDGYAGEIGHMTVDPAGARCRCGAIGCWETQVDARALLRAAGADPLPDGPDLTRKARAVLDDARAGHARALAATDSVATALGAGLASLVHVLGPDRIVLGGYLADLVELAAAAVRHPIRARAFTPEAREVPIVAARHREDAALVGAAEVALEPLLSDPLRLLT